MHVPLHPDLTGQVALVTGANRGLGAAIAEGLAEHGATVYAAARNPEEVASRPRIIPVRMDLTNEDSILEAMVLITGDAGRLDILVNNAGIVSDWDATILSEPTAHIDAVLETNLRGTLLVTKHALPLLLEQPGSRVVNVSSGAGAFTEGAEPGAFAYRISKAGMNALTAYLDAEYRGEGLIANCVCPGWVRTDMGGAEAPRSIPEGAETPLWLCLFAPGAPSGRFWRDREIIPW
ncbi:MAG TPA: SDR family NAD(P)-dependent oxidoreductase [Candidatus Thermoplasmatota archaeon]|nr:SDR family NAD(P)-dependent oxidoreductase [Candidatus Thermoplasmatota archaeon]